MMALLLPPAKLGTAETSARPAFCEDEVVHDYTRPFRNMSEIHMPPSSGRLPFAPSQTFLTQPERKVLVAEDGIGPEFSYGFSSYSSVERTHRLNWLILARVIRVTSRGNPIEMVDLLRRSIGTITDAEFGRISLPFMLAKKEALYRVDLIFKKKRGSLLGRYSQYLRVVRPTVRVNLALHSTVVQPGELLYFRIKNAGTVNTHYADPFTVERLEGSGWAVFLSETELGPWRRIMHVISGGMAGNCQSLMLPADISPGRYRIKKNLARPAKTVTAEFEVTP